MHNESKDKEFTNIADILESASFSGINSSIKTHSAQQTTNVPQPPTLHDQKMTLIRETLKDISEKLLNVARLLDDSSHTTTTRFNTKPLIDLTQAEPIDGTIIEGVFDGQHMIGADGKQYKIPANYASKSKLVEGDMLKLTITKLGAYVFKQIGPTQRARLRGTLVYNEQEKTHSVHVEGKTYRVLTASVTFYKGTVGDEVTILVPKDSPSQWAAVENILHRS